MEWPYKHFTKEEMACKCGCGGLPKEDLMRELEAIRERCGFPLVVTSGYRCPKHNAAVSHTGTKGPHTTGYAVDISVSDEQAMRVLRFALEFDVQGVGIGNNFLHLDWCYEFANRPALWSY